MTQVYSVSGLADHWGCGTDTVYSLIKGGDLPAFKLGGKLLRIRADEVERYECRTITASNDSASNLPSSFTRMESVTDIRLERLIERQPRPQLVHSGTSDR